MDVRTIPIEEIELISIQSLINKDVIVTNTGLSQELIKELSSDISADVLIQLLKIQIDGVWRTFCNNPTDFVGVDELGREVYTTTWGGEEWLYLPFDIALSSVKSSGEIVGRSISIQNYNKDIAKAIENPTEAIPCKVYIISKKTENLVTKSEHVFLTTVTNNGAILQGELRPADILAEPFPSLSYNAYNFRR